MKKNIKQLGIYSLIFILISYFLLKLGIFESIGSGLILGFFAGLLNDIRTRLKLLFDSSNNEN
jgi:hypothetical protein